MDLKNGNQWHIEDHKKAFSEKSSISLFNEGDCVEFGKVMIDLDKLCLYSLSELVLSAEHF